MKRLATILALSGMLLGPVTAHALYVTIDSTATPGIEYTNPDTTVTTVQIANTYGGFTITNYGTGGARVESIEGSTDRLNLTGLSVKNNNSTTQTITITYQDYFNSTGSGYAGQQLSGAFSQANTANIIVSYAATGPISVGCEFNCDNVIDNTSLFDGKLTATNRFSFGPLRETEAVNPCGGTGTDCYYIFGSTTITLLPGQFVNLAGSHDIMLIEGAINDSGIIADFDAHQAEFHASEVPEPASILLLLIGLGPLGYFVGHKLRS